MTGCERGPPHGVAALRQPDGLVISNPGPGTFEAVVILPAGARATVDGTEMVPPWAA